jgi:putative NADH-flavin reductase
LVEIALAAGHTIHAGVHSHNNLKPHTKLSVVQCDATSKADLKNLLNGQDAAVSFIGHVKGSPPHVQADAMNALVVVMQELSMQRIVSLTGTGVRFPGDRISLIDRLLNLSISIIDPSRVKDGKSHVEVLAKSNLDWTVVRVLKLQNSSPKPFELRTHGPSKWYVGRQEVAQAVLQVLEQHSFFQQAPIIGRP